MSNEIIISKQQFLERMENAGFKKFNIQKTEKNNFPVQFPFLQNKEGKECSVKGEISILLGIDFKLFDFGKDDGEFFFEGIEYLFGTDRVISNKETNYLKNVKNGIINTTAKVFLNLDSEIKIISQASEIINKYVNFFLENVLLIENTEKEMKNRLRQYLSIMFDYDFKGSNENDKIRSNGLFVFSDKSYIDPNNEKNILFKGYNIIVAPNNNCNEYIKNECKIPKGISLYNDIMRKKGIREKIKILSILGNNEKFENWKKTTGKIILPIYENMKIILFATSKAKGEGILPVYYKSFSINIDRKNSNKEKPFKINVKMKISKIFNLTVKDLKSMINAAIDNDEDRWIKYSFIENKNTKEYLEKALDVISSNICFENQIKIKLDDNVEEKENKIEIEDQSQINDEILSGDEEVAEEK